jgi:rhodanese-related sulfurtransferase
MQPNTKFVAQLKEKVPAESVVMFLCRSGGRSHETAVAAMQAGYREAFNVLEGFEGDRDANGHRNSVSGWRARGLPWSQS